MVLAAERSADNFMMDGFWITAMQFLKREASVYVKS